MNEFFGFYLFGFYIRLGKNFALEVDILRKIKMWSEPSFNIDLNVCIHDGMDHCPQVNFIVTILWWKIIELVLYSVHHKLEDLSFDE